MGDEVGDGNGAGGDEVECLGVVGGAGAVGADDGHDLTAAQLTGIGLIVIVTERIPRRDVLWAAELAKAPGGPFVSNAKPKRGAPLDPDWLAKLSDWSRAKA